MNPARTNQKDGGLSLTPATNNGNVDVVDSSLSISTRWKKNRHKREETPTPTSSSPTPHAFFIHFSLHPLPHQRARAQALNRCSVAAGGKLEQLPLRLLPKLVHNL